MIVPIHPPLDGTSAERFLALSQGLSQLPITDESGRERLLKAESDWVMTHAIMGEEKRHAYDASVRVLVDLHRLGWQVRESGYGIELSVQQSRTGGLTPAEIHEEKTRTKAMFKPAVDAQLGDAAVRAFIDRMEQPGSKTGKHPITALIADGAELHARLTTGAREGRLKEGYAQLPIRLTEAFQSRPNKTWLRPYTLHEMAGIVWLHGKSSLDGEELSQDACYEIAARNRCNPRRSVRELSETLRPHFFSKVMAQKEGTPSMADVAELLVRDNIAQFYDLQGVDSNGLDNIALRFLRYLRQQGAASEPTLRQALGLAHPQDFIETAEYLLRLGLIETSSAGRRLTRQGERYLKSDSLPDLRDRISRAG